MSGDEYNPNSVNAMFARILERLDQQDKSAGDVNRVIFSKLEHIEKRTTKLENALTWMRGNAAAISGGVAVAVWIFQHFIKP